MEKGSNPDEPKKAIEFDRTPKYIGWLFFDEITGKYRLMLRWPKKFNETFELAQDALDRCDQLIGADTNIISTMIGFRVLNPEYLRRIELDSRKA